MDKKQLRAVQLRNKIIMSKTGDAQKRALIKEPSIQRIKERTQRITNTPLKLDRPEPEMRKPSDKDLFKPEECICIELLTSGFVDSFSDFFKITHPAIPGSFHYDYWSNKDGDGVGPQPPVVPADKYNFLQSRLVESEKARRKGDDAELAKSYTEISQYFQSLNDMKIAIIYLEKLRDYAIFTSDLLREAQALREIARLFKETGNLESSLHFCEECLQVSVSLGDKVPEAQADLIEAYRKYSEQLISRGEGQTAIDYLQKSLNIASESGNLVSLAICHHELGLCYKQLEQLENAIEHFEQAYSIYKGVGNIEGLSASVSALATSYKYIGNTQRAIEYFTILHELANQTGNAEDKAMSCLTMGKIKWEQNEKAEALEWFQKNFDISVELDDPAIIEDSRISLGVSLATYRMSKYVNMLRDPNCELQLLNWNIDRNDAPLK